MVVRSKGFTLIELLVVLAIVGIMMAISGVGIVSVRNQRQVQVAAEQIRDAIIEAHAYAIAPQDNPSVVSIDSIKVNINSSARTLNVMQDTDSIMIDKGFSTKIKIGCSPLAGNTCVEFIANDPNKIGQTTVNLPIIVENADGTIKYQLKTDPISGSVKMEKI